MTTTFNLKTYLISVGESDASQFITLCDRIEKFHGKLQELFIILKTMYDNFIVIPSQTNSFDIRVANKIPLFLHIDRHAALIFSKEFSEKLNGFRLQSSVKEARDTFVDIVKCMKLQIMSYYRRKYGAQIEEGVIVSVEEILKNSNHLSQEPSLSESSISLNALMGPFLRLGELNYCVESMKEYLHYVAFNQFSFYICLKKIFSSMVISSENERNNSCIKVFILDLYALFNRYLKESIRCLCVLFGEIQMLRSKVACEASALKLAAINSLNRSTSSTKGDNTVQHFEKITRELGLLQEQQDLFHLEDSLANDGETDKRLKYLSLHRQQNKSLKLSLQKASALNSPVLLEVIKRSSILASSLQRRLSVACYKVTALKLSLIEKLAALLSLFTETIQNIYTGKEILDTSSKCQEIFDPLYHEDLGDDFLNETSNSLALDSSILERTLNNMKDFALIDHFIRANLDGRFFITCQNICTAPYLAQMEELSTGVQWKFILSGIRAIKIEQSDEMISVYRRKFFDYVRLSHNIPLDKVCCLHSAWIDHRAYILTEFEKSRDQLVFIIKWCLQKANESFFVPITKALRSHLEKWTETCRARHLTATCQCIHELRITLERDSSKFARSKAEKTTETESSTGSASSSLYTVRSMQKENKKIWKFPEMRLFKSITKRQIKDQPIGEDLRNRLMTQISNSNLIAFEKSSKGKSRALLKNSRIGKLIQQPKPTSPRKNMFSTFSGNALILEKKDGIGSPNAKPGSLVECKSQAENRSNMAIPIVKKAARLRRRHNNKFSQQHKLRQVEGYEENIHASETYVVATRPDMTHEELGSL